MLIRDAQENKTAHFFPNKESMENHLISQMIHSIEDNLYNNITVEELCSEMNYSRAYLSKIFKATTGFTILEYILNRKIMQAKKLIKENDFNFSQISDKLSFDNPHYFTRVFKRISGMTPSEYKKLKRR
jgi:AraC-like DNA-binding protein